MEQSNSLGLIEIVSIPQASLLPLFIEAAVSIACPLASSWIVNGAAHSASGAMLSSTVTMVVQVDVFPLTSVTVSVTVFSPISAQVKLVVSKEIATKPQVTVLPPSTSAAVKVASPLVSRKIVNGATQNATGGKLSSTVTMVVHVAELPLASVTVRVMVLSPMSAQVNSVLSMERKTSKQLSVLPLSIMAAVIVACPFVSSSKVKGGIQKATGGIFSSTVTIVVHVAVFPFTLVMVRVTKFSPISAQVKSVLSISIEATPQGSLLPLSMSLRVILA